MSKTPTGPAKAKVPRGRRVPKPPVSAKVNQATTDDMQREGLGIAAKE